MIQPGAHRLDRYVIRKVTVALAHRVGTSDRCLLDYVKKSAGQFGVQLHYACTTSPSYAGSMHRVGLSTR